MGTIDELKGLYDVSESSVKMFACSNNRWYRDLPPGGGCGLETHVKGDLKLSKVYSWGSLPNGENAGHYAPAMNFDTGDAVNVDAQAKDGRALCVR
jgi:hypothetical protein